MADRHILQREDQAQTTTLPTDSNHRHTRWPLTGGAGATQDDVRESGGTIHADVSRR